MKSKIDNSREDKILENISRKIQESLAPSKLEIINQSKNHKQHKLFEDTKLYLKIYISECKKMEEISRINQHRIIHSILKDFIPDPIHSLSIIIK